MQSPRRQLRWCSSHQLLLQSQIQCGISHIFVRKSEEGPPAEPLSEPCSNVDAVVVCRLGAFDDPGNGRAGRCSNRWVQARLLHHARLLLHLFDDHLPCRPEQLDMKNPVADEISCDTNLPIAIDGARFIVFVGPQAAFCTPGELVCGDLALPGEILVTSRSLKGQKKMTKQRLAEKKLRGSFVYYRFANTMRHVPRGVIGTDAQVLFQLIG